MKNAIHYHEKSLSFFEPWLEQIDMKESERIGSLDEVKIDEVNKHLSNIELKLGKCHQNLDNF